MQSKRQKAQDLISKGKDLEALKIMGTIGFRKNEADGQKIIEARDAYLNPSLYKQIGIDVEKTIEEGIYSMKTLLSSKE